MQILYPLLQLSTTLQSSWVCLYQLCTYRCAHFLLFVLVDPLKLSDLMVSSGELRRGPFSDVLRGVGQSHGWASASP